MEKNNVLDVGDIPQVAMYAMNNVHQNELNIVNELNAAIFANDPEKVTQLCDNWLEHTMRILIEKAL